jgi:hypothetical protein
MPESIDGFRERVRAAEPGLSALVAEARRTWAARAGDEIGTAPAFRPFEDAFPTFYQFTNKPR